MKRVIALALVLTGLVFALSGSGPNTGMSPTMGARTGTSVDISNRSAGTPRDDVDLESLGSDLVTPIYLAPAIDFSSGTKYYFDPLVLAKGGDGLTQLTAFRAFGTEVASDSTIIHYNYADADQSANTAVVDEGDVCVLMPGNHGDITFTDYNFDTWFGIVGLRGSTFETLRLQRCQFFYMESMTNERILRSAFDTPGSTFSDAPIVVHISGKSVPADDDYSYIVVKDFDIASAKTAAIEGWSLANWKTNAPNGIKLQWIDRFVLQGNSLVGMNFGVQIHDALYGEIYNNRVYRFCADGVQVGENGKAMNNIAFRNNRIRDHYMVWDGGPGGQHNGMFQAFGDLDSIYVERNYLIATTDTTRSLITTQLGHISFTNAGTDTATNAQVYNNVIAGITYNGIIFQKATRSKVINNTLVPIMSERTAPVINLEVMSIGMTIVNNASAFIQQTGGGPHSWNTISDNYLFALEPGNALFRSWSWETVPLSYRLQPTGLSPMRYAGNATYERGTDFSGLTRPYEDAISSIGAYEYDSTPPDAPTGISASSRQSEVFVSWDANTEADLAGYTLRSSLVNNTEFTDLYTGTDNFYAHTGIQNELDYFYRVLAFDTAADSSVVSEVASATAQIIPPPEIPTGVTATAGINAVTISWDANAKAGVTYEIIRSLSPTGDITTVGSTQQLSFSDTGLDNDTTYYYRVRAVDLSGSVSGFSDQVSATPTAAADITPPPVVEFEAGPNGQDGELTFEWDTTLVSGLQDFSHFNIYRDSTGIGQALYKVLVDGAEYTDPNASLGVEFGYQMSTEDVSGNESAKNTRITGTSTQRDPFFSAGLAAEGDTTDSYTGFGGQADGLLLFDFEWTISQSSFIEPRFRFAAQDSFHAGVDTFWRNPASLGWDLDNELSLLPVAHTNVDSGGIILIWSGNANEDHLKLEFQKELNGPWFTVDANISAGTTTYTHEIGDTTEPTRGELNYRIRAYNTADESEPSDLSSLTTPFMNQAVRVLTKVIAVAAADSNGAVSAESEETSFLYISAQPPITDVIAPTVTAFSIVLPDTSDTDDVILQLSATINEASIGWWQWKEGVGGTWAPSRRWKVNYAVGDTSTFATTLIDTINTTRATTELDSVYVRLKARDEAGNISAFAQPTPYAFKFRRFGDVDPWVGALILSNYASPAGVDTFDTGILNVRNLSPSMSIDFDELSLTNTTVDWGAPDISWSSNRYTSDPPMGSWFGRDDGRRIFLTAGKGTRRFPFFNFGASTNLANTTIDSAKLYIKSSTIAFVNMDTLFVYACAGSDSSGYLSEWVAGGNDDACYNFSTGTTPWTIDIGLLNNDPPDPTPIWTKTMFGVGAAGPTVVTVSDHGSAANTFNGPFDVTALVQDQINYQRQFTFFLSFNGAGTADKQYASFFNSEDADPLNRPYLRIWSGGDVDPPAPAVPVSQFSASTTSIEIDQETASVTFTDLSTNSPTSWAWTFGSGQGSSTSQSPTKDYTTNAGTYTIGLTATNAQGAGNTETKVAHVIVTADATPPSIAAETFISAVFDTVGQANVMFEVTTNGLEKVKSWKQWKQGVGGTWAPASETFTPGSATTADDSLRADTGVTLGNISTLAGVKFYTRYKLQDQSAALNESAWTDAVETVFTRVTPASGGNAGYETIGTTNSSSIATNGTYGSSITMPEAGTVVSVTFYVVSDDASYSIAVALYAPGSGYALLAEGSTNLGGGLTGWYTVTLDTPYVASSSEEFFAVVAAKQGEISGTVTMERDEPTWDSLFSSISFSGFPADPHPGVTTYTDRRYSIYVTYE